MLPCPERSLGHGGASGLVTEPQTSQGIYVRCSLEGDACKTRPPAAPRPRPRLAQSGFSPRPNKERPVVTRTSFLWAAASRGLRRKGVRGKKGGWRGGQRGWLSLPAPPGALLSQRDSERAWGARQSRGPPRACRPQHSGQCSFNGPDEAHGVYLNFPTQCRPVARDQRKPHGL